MLTVPGQPAQIAPPRQGLLRNAFGGDTVQFDLIVTAELNTSQSAEVSARAHTNLNAALGA